MVYSWLSLVPVLLVFIIAFTVRNVLASLLAGIISAALIIHHGALFPTLTFIIRQLFEQLIMADHLYTFGFLLLLGVFIQIMTHSGGIAAYTSTLKKYLTDARSTQSMSLVVSLMFFLDDYLNTLTTGAIMKPLFDFYKISRVKLAYLLNAVSSPLCVIIPATSWVALILGQLQGIGIQEPFTFYLSSIPFLIYPFSSIISAWIIVRNRISYGAMIEYEKDYVNLDIPQYASGGMRHFIIPIVFFLTALITTFLYSGNSRLMGGNNSFHEVLNTANIFWTLFTGIVLTLIFSLCFFVLQKKINMKLIQQSFLDGILLMKNSLMLLLFAWTLGMLLKDYLNTGHYLAHLLLSFLSVKLFPFLLFIITALISASTGSAWGALVIMIPLGLPLVLNAAASLVVMSCGALLAGSVAGAHFSPISDATVIASTSAQCSHVEHVQTQITYSLPALIAASSAFIVGGFLGKLSYGAQLLTIWILALLVLYLVFSFYMRKKGIS